MMILLMLSLMNVYTALSLSCLLLCSSCMMSMFLPLYSSCMMNHVFMACIHSFIHSGNNTCVFVHDFINESKLSLSLSLFLPSSIPIPVFSSHGAYMI